MNEPSFNGILKLNNGINSAGNSRNITKKRTFNQFQKEIKNENESDNN